MKVRGAIFEATGKPLVIEELDMLDKPGRGQVLVRYRASGLCRTDLSRMHDPNQAPEVFGHEGAGVIDAVGEGVTGFAIGDKVIASFRGSCGECFYCLRGENPHCEWGGGAARETLRALRFTRPDGSSVVAGLGTHAEASILPTQFVVKVETDLPFEQLALIGCAVTTGFGAAVNTAGVHPGSTVSVIGCGGVGQSAIRGAEIAGAALIIAIDNVQSKLDYALEHGATHAILASPDTDTVEEVRKLTQGRGVDYAIEFTGLADNVLKGYEMIRRRGAVITVGIHAPTFEIPLRQFILDEKQIRGSLYGSSVTRIEFPRLVKLAEQGKLDLESMVTNVITLDEINEGYEAMERGDVIRTVVSYV